MNALLDLAARCEAAEGPDRELDALIYAALNADSEPFEHGTTGEWFVRTQRGLDFTSPAPVSASIDAALTLLPDGWSRIEYGRYEDTPNRYWAQISGFDKLAYSEDCATPALALIAACLRAHATNPEPSHD